MVEIIDHRHVFVQQTINLFKSHALNFELTVITTYISFWSVFLAIKNLNPQKRIKYNYKLQNLPECAFWFFFKEPAVNIPLLVLLHLQKHWILVLVS